jgi:hypothetical protein
MMISSLTTFTKLTKEQIGLELRAITILTREESRTHSTKHIT